MKMTKNISQAPRRAASDRRGAALVLTLILLIALFAISAGALLMTGTEIQLRKYTQWQVKLEQLAELAGEMGLSRLNRDEDALPDTGYAVLESDYPVSDAMDEPIPGVALSVYAARTGSATGRTGSFASVVGQATGGGGTAIVRVELAQESFAKYAYFTNSEGGNIWFAAGDEMFGPVHSNDQVKIWSAFATFHSELTTASTVLYPDRGVFMEGYTENVPRIEMPAVEDFDRMQALADAGGTYFETPSTGDAKDAEMRIEFLAIDVNGDGDDTDPNEGFFRIYRSKFSEWVGAYDDNDFWIDNCGDVHAHPTTGEPWFVSARNHEGLFNVQVYDLVEDEFVNYVGPYQAEVEAWQSQLKHGQGDWEDTHREAVKSASARCLLGGDPRLTLDNRTFDPWNGTDDDLGWLRREEFAAAAVIPDELAARDDAEFLFPLDREYNPEFRGVIFFDGLVGVSGILNGRVTIVTSDNMALLDDFIYSVPANAELCNDIAGLLSKKNVYVANNSLNAPQKFEDVGGGYRTYDETTAESFDAIILTLDESFTVEKYDDGSKDAEPCEGLDKGRGCLYLTGGLIQETRGAVGLTTGQGYKKRYTYDSNARFCPPPHFPTTGAYRKNRYYSVNPGGFQDIGEFFAELR